MNCARSETLSSTCSDNLGEGRPSFHRQLITRGTDSAEATTTLTPGHEWLLEVREQGNDAVVEIRDAADHLLAQADHPERRTGTRRIILSPQALPPPDDSGTLSLRVTGKEHAAVTGVVEIAAYALASLSRLPTCLGAYRSLAAADADYAIAQQISLGRLTSQTPAREIYMRAAEEYLAAEALLHTPGNAILRGEVALALAGVRYFDLQDWREAAEWADTAVRLLGPRDPYRRARAEALAAAAWIEMATDSAPAAAPGTPAPKPKELLRNARRTLRRLATFHLQRHEPYDAALQINNIGLAYMYDGRFPQCIAAAHSASRLFASLNEAPRQALAWQNQALCHWGLGHLPEALAAFNRALTGLKPDPYPQLYLLTLNNTALINFALGHLDESLRLHDRSLELATRTQNPREQAQSLYGIGVTYYALGDRIQAREFLERALAIRTAAFDGRGRRATLRSLATIHADDGEYAKAIDLDREALELANASDSQAATRIQLARHTAQGGDLRAALQMFAELIDSADLTDPLLQAQARLGRAVVERRAGVYEAALRDLSIAISIFRKFSQAPDEFAAGLERARVLHLTGYSNAALLALDQALNQSQAIRSQTANPELRAQLQLPLRPAYDLKLDLLYEKYGAATKAGEEHEATRLATVAFHSADAARARSFADIAAQQYSPAQRPELTGDLSRRDTLYQSLAGLRYALDIRLDRSGSADPRAKALTTEIAGLQRQVDTLNNAIATRTAIHVVPTDPTTRRAPAPITQVAAGPAAQLAAGSAPHVPADAAIIAYWLGEQSAYAWAITPAGIHWVRLSDTTSLTEAARAFHDALNRLADLPRERRLETASVLYTEIIRPIEQWVRPYKRWFFIPDAALDYVPFAALRTDAKATSPYIIAAHDVAVAPAAWMLLAAAHRASSPRPGRILLVSDPVYELSDPRLNLSHPLGTHASAMPSRTDAAAIHTLSNTDRLYRRIPGTAREAAAIQAQFPASDIDALSGVQAARGELLRRDWSQYRFIHIASHGYIDARMPQLSALVLSTYDQNGTPIQSALRTADLSSLTLTADVAVFSGCETALGKEVLNEGMVGIAYATLARGAGAVVSSLWQLPDEISANLMTDLYRHLEHDSMSPLTALSASMRSVLDRNPSADPALWAAFQVSVATTGESAYVHGRSLP